MIDMEGESSETAQDSSAHHDSKPSYLVMRVGSEYVEYSKQDTHVKAGYQRRTLRSKGHDEDKNGIAFVDSSFDEGYDADIEVRYPDYIEEVNSDDEQHNELRSSSSSSLAGDESLVDGFRKLYFKEAIERRAAQANQASEKLLHSPLKRGHSQTSDKTQDPDCYEFLDYGTLDRKRQKAQDQYEDMKVLGALWTEEPMDVDAT